MYERLFRKTDSANLRAYVVWVPKLFAEEGDIIRGLKTVPDPRATHFWDGDGIYLKSYARGLDLPKVFSGPIDAWDIFMIYGPSDQWREKLPPPPVFWMHQLLFPGIKAGRLDAKVFAARTRRLLQQTNPSASAWRPGMTDKPTFPTWSRQYRLDDSSSHRYQDFGSGIHIIPVVRPLFSRCAGRFGAW